MQWSEVRERFPDQFVLFKALDPHFEQDKLYIENVEVIRAIPDPKEATKILVSSKPENEFVYHTGKDKVIMEVMTRPGYRRIPLHEN